MKSYVELDDEEKALLSGGVLVLVEMAREGVQLKGEDGRQSQLLSSMLLLHLGPEKAMLLVEKLTPGRVKLEDSPNV